MAAAITGLSKGRRPITSLVLKGQVQAVPLRQYTTPGRTGVLSLVLKGQVQAIFMRQETTPGRPGVLS